MDSSDAHDAPATFEVGISDVAANPLIEVSVWQLVFYQGQFGNLDGNCAQCLGVICCMQPLWGWQEVGSDLLQHAVGTAWSPLDPHTLPEQAFDSAVRGMAVGDKTSIQVYIRLKVLFASGVIGFTALSVKVPCHQGPSLWDR